MPGLFNNGLNTLILNIDTHGTQAHSFFKVQAPKCLSYKLHWNHCAILKSRHNPAHHEPRISTWVFQRIQKFSCDEDHQWSSFCFFSKKQLWYLLSLSRQKICVWVGELLCVSKRKRYLQIFEDCYATRHTITHCNILQRTAHHYNILQHNTIHWNTLHIVKGCHTTS